MTVYAPTVPEWRGLDVPAVARRIKEERLKAGLSQRQLAFPGCSAAYISRLEASQRVPSGHLLEELARRMGTTRSYIETGKHSVTIELDAALVQRAAVHNSPVAWGELFDVLKARVRETTTEHVQGLA